MTWNCVPWNSVLELYDVELCDLELCLETFHVTEFQVAVFQVIEFKDRVPPSERAFISEYRIQLCTFVREYLHQMEYISEDLRRQVRTSDSFFYFAASA